MNYKVLIIRNGATLQIGEHLAQFRTWIQTKTPLRVSFDYLDTNIVPKYKLFTHVQGRQYYGLDGIKDILRKRKDVVNGYYQQIIYVYEPDGFNPGADGVLCAWTYPNDLFGSPFSEVFHDPKLPEPTFLVQQLCHETVHGMHRRLWFQGIYTIDDMDIYDKNSEIYALDGNYQRNLSRLGIWWNRIAEEVSALTLARAREALKTFMDKFDAKKRLHNAIIQVESSGNDYAIGDTNLVHKAYGPMQIRQPYVTDVNRAFGTSYTAESCLGNRALSIDIFEKYMSLYANPISLGKEPTDQDRARIHNGGPQGWYSPLTVKYWEKIKKYL